MDLLIGVLLFVVAAVAWYRTVLGRVSPNWARACLSVVMGFATLLVISLVLVAIEPDLVQGNKATPVPVTVTVTIPTSTLTPPLATPRQYPTQPSFSEMMATAASISQTQLAGQVLVTVTPYR